MNLLNKDKKNPESKNAFGKYSKNWSGKLKKVISYHSARSEKRRNTEIYTKATLVKKKQQD